MRFDKMGCQLSKTGTNDVFLHAKRVNANLYEAADVQVERQVGVQVAKTAMSPVDNMWYWHKTLGHLPFDSAKLMKSKNMVHGLEDVALENAAMTVKPACLRGCL